MPIRCDVLAKISPSYSYVGGYEVEDNATVDSISEAAERLAAKHHQWNPEARVRIKLYQVSSNPTSCSRLRTSIDAFAADSVARR